MAAMSTADHLDWSRQDLRRFSDVLRLRNGQSVTVRFVEPRDGPALQAYFKTLSPEARYNRFTGASNGLSNHELDVLLHIGDDNRFAVIAEMTIDGIRTIVGEARYRVDETAGTLEFGLSVDDAHRGQGIGFALLSNLECRAAAFGVHRVFGDTLRTNNQMQSLARKAGYSFTNTPGDWREVRMMKTVHIAAEDIPCVQWRNVAVELAHHAGM
ncbi:GNAT family N-acetyltransferase [Bradyrhizobium prioriisuperbiae]|uniref:GNAT family N-acetyltransferase n=1 Tax=Bradyrhizobium prioriisuperbiae TaxID=2854389 RepID=UPI0028E4FE02|nr:GNAT family N-acetyltransferase [Bradyrhizobium prioritasuperba]